MSGYERGWVMIASAEEFKRYIESKNDEDNSRALDSASDEVWFDILSKYPELSRDVVFNHTISVEVLERLSLSDDMNVRWNVAMKRRVNRTIFERLACDENISVRHRIACNPKAPEDVLLRLSTDKDPIVAEAAKKRLSLNSGSAQG